MKGNSWDFPLIAKYRLVTPARPYVAGGGVLGRPLRRKGNCHGWRYALMFTQVCTCGWPRKYQTIVGLSNCHTSHTLSTPRSRF